jgi:hypothetical protein
MSEDPIVAEVRRVREEHAAKFGYDLDAIFRDIKEQERKSGCTLVTFPPRPARYYGPADPLRPGADLPHKLNDDVARESSAVSRSQ